MLTISENTILLRISDTNPERRYKKIATALNAAFRWHACDNSNYQNGCFFTEANNLVALSDLMEAVLNSTLINENSVCIHIQNQGEEELNFYVRALIAAFRWSVHERRFCDNDNLIELTRLLGQLTDKEIDC